MGEYFLTKNQGITGVASGRHNYKVINYFVNDDVVNNQGIIRKYTRIAMIWI